MKRTRDKKTIRKAPSGTTVSRTRTKSFGFCAFEPCCLNSCARVPGAQLARLSGPWASLLADGGHWLAASAGPCPRDGSLVHAGATVPLRFSFTGKTTVPFSFGDALNPMPTYRIPTFCEPCPTAQRCKKSSRALSEVSYRTCQHDSTICNGAALPFRFSCALRRLARQLRQLGLVLGWWTPSPVALPGLDRPSRRMAAARLPDSRSHAPVLEQLALPPQVPG